jgi:chromosome segregation ATPase
MVNSAAAELEAAEERIRTARAEVAKLREQHERAARELRTCDGDLQRAAQDPEVYARRLRDVNAARSVCTRIESEMAVATERLEAAQQATLRPRRALWEAEAAALVEQEPTLRESLQDATEALSVALGAALVLQKELFAVEQRTRRMAALEREGVAMDTEVADPRAKVEMLRRQGQALLEVAPNPERCVRRGLHPARARREAEAS